MSKTYRIICDGEVIGTSALEERDAGMGTASGQFEPATAYQKVRWVFRTYSDAQREQGPADEQKVAEYYRRRDELNLSVESANGQSVPVTVVHISDFADETDHDAYEVEVHSADPAFFARPHHHLG